MDGISDCIDLFETLKNDDSIQGLFIEANTCKGGCLGGPVLRSKHKNPHLSQFNLDDDPMPYDDTPVSYTHLDVYKRQRDESASLADRFGLVVTFTKPNLADFMEIVCEIAKERGIELDEETLKKLSLIHIW